MANRAQKPKGITYVQCRRCNRGVRAGFLIGGLCRACATRLAYGRRFRRQGPHENV